MFDEIFKIIDKTRLVDDLEKKGHLRRTLNKSIQVGSFSKKIAPDVEILTSISAVFWMRPDIYNTKGERKTAGKVG